MSPSEITKMSFSLLVREYAEALALYREKTNQVRDLRGFIDQLDHIMSDRQNRYKIMRR